MRKNTSQSSQRSRFSWAVTPAKVHKAVRLLIKVGRPNKIILFGSYITGHMNAHSDLDMLVVKQGPVRNPRQESARLRRRLGDIVMPMDILVIPESRLNALKERRDLVYREALTTGRIFYEADKKK